MKSDGARAPTFSPSAAARQARRQLPISRHSRHRAWPQCARNVRIMRELRPPSCLDPVAGRVQKTPALCEDRTARAGPSGAGGNRVTCSGRQFKSYRTFR
jgi:hypothetical protein